MPNSFNSVMLRFLRIWRRIKYPVGYSLFILVVGYGLSKAPQQLWLVQPIWLLLSMGVVIVMFFFQQWQINVFLQAHGAQSGWLYPALFNARKGILNTIFPARSGTLLLLHSLANRYAVQWHNFLHFFLLTGFVSIYVSGLALLWLLFPWGYSAALLLASLLFSRYLAQHARFRYADCLLSLLFIALGLYIATVAAFFSLLRGLGYSLNVVEVSYFAVLLNILAQVSITPGNIGIREIVMGLVAPYVSLPISVGIIASSVLLALRLIVYGVFWAGLECLSRLAARNPSTMDES